MFFQSSKFSVLLLSKLCIYLGRMAGLGTLAGVFNTRYLALEFTAFIYLQDHMFDIT